MRTQIRKEALSDGSKVFAVVIVCDDGSRFKIDAVDFKHADRIIEALDSGAVSANACAHFYNREAA